MFAGASVARRHFFQTGWAGEEALGAGLVGSFGAILPSRGSGFTKAKAVSVHSRCDLAVKRSG